MLKPAVFDTVELLHEKQTDDHILPAGTRGTVIHQYADQIYGVEFINSSSRTPFEVVLLAQQMTVIWQASSRQHVPLREQLAQVIDYLPEPEQAELLEVARALNARMLEALLEVYDVSDAVPTS
jgi:hypothetical protein